MTAALDQSRRLAFPDAPISEMSAAGGKVEGRRADVVDPLKAAALRLLAPSIHNCRQGGLDAWSSGQA
jgi:hypothetical protein